MYIRRKVFSVALDENGEERYFSTNEIINEEDYLDEVLYSEKKEKEKKSHLGRNIALGTAGTAALAGGGIYAADRIGKNIEYKNLAKWAETNPNNEKVLEELEKKIAKGRKLRKPAETIVDSSKYVGEKAKEAGKYVGKKAKGASKSAEDWIVNNAKRGDAWVKANPWKTVGGAAAATAAIGGGIYSAKKLKERKSRKK